MSAGHYCDCEADCYPRRLPMACTARFSRGSARGCSELSGTRASGLLDRRGRGSCGDVAAQPLPCGRGSAGAD